MSHGALQVFEQEWWTCPPRCAVHLCTCPTTAYQSSKKNCQSITKPFWQFHQINTRHISCCMVLCIVFSIMEFKTCNIFLINSYSALCKKISCYTLVLNSVLLWKSLAKALVCSSSLPAFKHFLLNTFLWLYTSCFLALCIRTVPSSYLIDSQCVCKKCLHC